MRKNMLDDRLKNRPCFQVLIKNSFAVKTKDLSHKLGKGNLFGSRKIKQIALDILLF